MTLEIIRNTFAEGRELTVGMIVTDLAEATARDLLTARKAVVVRRVPPPTAAALAPEPMETSRPPRRKKGQAA